MISSKPMPLAPASRRPSPPGNPSGKCRAWCPGASRAHRALAGRRYPAFDAAAGDDLHRGTRGVERDHACVGRDADIHCPGADERHVVGEGRRRDEFQNNTIRRRDLPRVREEQREAAEARAIGARTVVLPARAMLPPRTPLDKPTMTAPLALRRSSARRESNAVPTPRNARPSQRLHMIESILRAAVRPGETRPASMLGAARRPADKPGSERHAAES